MDLSASGDGSGGSGSGSGPESGLTMSRPQMELLGYGLFLAAFAVADFVMGGRYELHIILDAAASYCFPVTVLYFFYPKVSLWLSLVTCAALVMYWVHHMMRSRATMRVTFCMLVLTMYVAVLSAQDLRTK